MRKSYSWKGTIAKGTKHVVRLFGEVQMKQHKRRTVRRIMTVNKRDVRKL
uniref:Uncharacterized protein n=1 Tax=Solanum lycopersicum TaxID=4081 RepID=A0A3Q7J054_SOLLC